jgi:CheY-like chemotaxis protein
MINAEDIYFLNYLGKQELAAPGTSLSAAELELLVLIDGYANVAQLQAGAKNLAPGAVVETLDKLLRSEHIALQEIDLSDLFSATATSELKGEMPSEGMIARGVSALRQNGFVVRIARRAPIERKPARSKQFVVMVVEDERDLAENMCMVLTRAGFVARIAMNREQIVAGLSQPPLPDLVLLDVSLPDADGFDVLAKLRQHPTLGKVSVILATGAATREAVLKGLLGEANGYITKPFEIGVLVKAVGAVLGIAVDGTDAEHGFLWEDDR